MYIDIYTTKLSLDGYQVIHADNGETGLAKAHSEQPDAILLDIMLPKMNGQDVLKALKGDEATKHIPVIMLSILNQETRVNEALDSGAECYLVKSNTTPAQIVDEIERSMDLAKK